MVFLAGCIGDHQRIAAEPCLGAGIHVHDLGARLLRGAAREPAVALLADRIVERRVGVRELVAAVDGPGERLGMPNSALMLISREPEMSGMSPSNTTRLLSSRLKPW